MIDPELVTRKLVLIAEDLPALEALPRARYMDGVRAFLERMRAGGA